MADPFPKEAQLERGPKRPARIKANGLEWARIRGLKMGPCRCYGIECAGRVELHHLVPRSWGGDDLEDNIAPLCSWLWRVFCVGNLATFTPWREILTRRTT